MSDIIPVLNGGSSSLKFSIFEIVEQSLVLRITGQIEGLGRSPRFVAKNEKGELLEERHWENGGPRISTADSPVSAWVIPTDEEKMMALHTLGLISKGDTAS